MFKTASKMASKIAAKAVNSARFEWMRDCKNTIRELTSLYGVSKAVAVDMQHGIATGQLQEVDCWQISAAAAALCEQVGF